RVPGSRICRVNIMTASRARRTAAMALSALLLAGAGNAAAPKKQSAPAAPTPLPRPAEVRSLDAYPKAVALKGSDASAQLLVTAQVAGGSQDLTGDVAYEVADAKVARVTSSGRVVPLADGATTVTARFGDHAATVPVKVEAVAADLPINFGN